MFRILVASCLLLLYANANANDNPTCRILVAGGGGSRGSFEAGVISNLIDSSNDWDFFTGISVGSLNTMFLATTPGQDLKNASMQLRKLWSILRNEDVFKYRPSTRSLLDSSPLEKTITRYLGNAKIYRNISIGTTSLNTGKLEIFRESDLLMPSDIVSALMASTAIPIAFPPYYYNKTLSWFVDGGTTGNIVLDFNRCQLLGKQKVIIDVIVCAPLINNVSSTEIDKYNLYNLAWRNYDILTNMLSNHPLQIPCPKSEGSPNIDVRNIKIRLHQPIKPLNVSLLDFTHGEELWQYGYSKSFVTEFDYCS
jgi:predicted acylesterase/phospholipase RssA